MGPRAPAIVAPFAAGLAIEAASSFQTGVSGGWLQGSKWDQGNAAAAIALGLEGPYPPLMAFPIVGSACGSPGEGIAGPPAHMMAFQVAFQPVGFPDLRLRGAPDQDRFFEVGFVNPVGISDALGVRLAVAA
jgi:hypothetical protein